MSASLKTIDNNGLQSERHQIGDAELTANSIERWEHSTEKMENIRKDLDISKAVYETEDHCPEKDLVLLLKEEIFLVMKTKVKSVVSVPKTELLRSTDEETFWDTFPDGYDADKEGVRDSSYQFMKYVLTHLRVVRTPESVLALTFDRW